MPLPELPPIISEVIEELSHNNEELRAHYRAIAIGTIAFFGEQQPFNEHGYNIILPLAVSTFGETNEDFAVIVSVASLFARKVMVEGYTPAQVRQMYLFLPETFSAIGQ